MGLHPQLAPPGGVEEADVSHHVVTQAGGDRQLSCCGAAVVRVHCVEPPGALRLVAREAGQCGPMGVRSHEGAVFDLEDPDRQIIDRGAPLALPGGVRSLIADLAAHTTALPAAG